MRELSHHLLDLLENSLDAGATSVALTIVEDTTPNACRAGAGNRLTITVQDNGRGMDEETVRRASDPYYTTRTTRHVGMGLALLKAAAEGCNGHLEITSVLGAGTRVVADFQRDHIDRAPLGDMASTLMGVILRLGPRSRAHDVRLHYKHEVISPGQSGNAKERRVFECDTEAIRAELDPDHSAGYDPLIHPRVREWLDEYIREGLSSVQRPGS